MPVIERKPHAVVEALREACLAHPSQRAMQVVVNCLGTDPFYVRADPRSRSSLVRAIAAVLVARGWRYRRGSTAPWVPPGGDDQADGYSLLGAAARQAEIEGSAPAFQRHAEALQETR